MKLTGEQLLDFISKLASPVRKVFGAGPPSLIGGEKWQLDLSGIAPADRPAAVKAAAAKCATTLPDGSALQIGSLQEEQLQRAGTVAIYLPDDDAVEKLFFFYWS